ncbi:MAG: DUF2796 domain-containing protein [Nitrincola sp.]|nr:DUF2796 domain-containing protein [Nitrincola sp.]
MVKLTLPLLLAASSVAFAHSSHNHGHSHDHNHDHNHDHSHEHHSLDAHVHGMAHLDVVLEDNMLLASIKAPAADLVGFEHVATSDEDKNKVYDMLGKMELADILWTLPEAAQCERQDVHVEHELLKADHHSGHDHKHDHDHSHDHKHDHSHSHDHKHDHSHDHDHKHDHAHSDVLVDYHYECAHPEQLGSVPVNLFNNFPSLHEIQGQLILPSGQKGQTLTPAQNMIQFN